MDLKYKNKPFEDKEKEWPMSLHAHLRQQKKARNILGREKLERRNGREREVRALIVELHRRVSC